MKKGNEELLKEFSAAQIKKLDAIIDKYKGKPGGLIPVLEEAQVALEYLPISVQKRIAKGLNLPLSRVYGVVTFYSFFTMTPRGRHTVRVCLGTACYVRGGKAIAENIDEGIRHQGRRNDSGPAGLPMKRSAAWAPAAWGRSSSSTKTSTARMKPSKSKKYSANTINCEGTIMAKLKIEDLKKIKEKVHAETALREGHRRVKVTVHMGTCGIASGAKEVMDSLMSEIEEAGVRMWS